MNKNWIGGGWCEHGSRVLAFATDDVHARGWADVETHWRAVLTFVAGAVYDGESCLALAHGRGVCGC
jgi:hypothetical protein